ncbi:MAG: hypothetical protein AMXMBFR84_32640 [Candidatus Hydrogenedentota bacterium]
MNQETDDCAKTFHNLIAAIQRGQINVYEYLLERISIVSDQWDSNDIAKGVHSILVSEHFQKNRHSSVFFVTLKFDLWPILAEPERQYIAQVLSEVYPRFSEEATCMQALEAIADTCPATFVNTMRSLVKICDEKQMALIPYGLYYFCKNYSESHKYSEANALLNELANVQSKIVRAEAQFHMAKLNHA